MNKLIQEYKNYTSYLLQDKERCFKFLISAGIIDKNNNLTSNYE